MGDTAMMPAAPPIPSAAAWAANSAAYDRAYNAGKNWANYGRKRRYRRKRKSAPARKSGGAYQIYQPTGQVAGVIGRGGYFTDALRAVGRSLKRMTPDGAFSRLGSAAGGALGTAYGNPGMGAKMGGLFGQGIASIAGFGDYHVTANSLMNRVDEGVQIPQFANSEHATIIRHREFVQDILVPATPTAFTNLSFQLNPGIQSTFPWLAGVASNFDSYQILGMIIEFRTNSSDITTGGALGSVIMATNYNSVDSPFPNKIEMENSEYAVSNKPSVTTVHCLECDPGMTFSPIKYIRSGPVPSGKDPRLYDLGKFQLATVGLPGSTGEVMGELWISYEIAFYKPNLTASLTSGFDHFDLSAAITASNYLGADAVNTFEPEDGSTIGGTINTSTYTFPSTVRVGQRFLLTYVVFGASTATAVAPAFGNLVGCSALTFFNQTGVDQASFNGSNAGQTVSRITVTQAIELTATTASISITAGTMLTTPTGGDFYVQLLPDSME